MMAECSDSSVTNNANLQKQKVVSMETLNEDENKNDKAVEPMLIEDINDQDYPKSLKVLREELLNRQIHPTIPDMVPLFIHILMLEKGFIPNLGSYDGYYSKFHAKQVIELAAKFPNNWKRSASHYEMEFVIAHFPLYVCKIVCVVNMGNVIINSIVKGIPEASYSMMVDPKLYFLTNDRFQNVRKFAVAFKDQIGFPTRLEVLRRHNITITSLQHLPIELIIYIRNYLNDPVNFERAFRFT